MDQSTEFHLSPDESEILKADFNPVVKTYIFWYILVILVSTVIGIPVALVWVLGWGQWYSRKFYENMVCVLTTKNLRLRNGIIFQIEKTIPLENIQDLTFLEGPILKAWHLSMIKVETAGSSHQYGSQMKLIGVINAHEFRSKVLTQRSLTKSSGTLPPESQTAILTEIRDLLREIRDNTKSNKPVGP
ncbi:PH domain-containing protein [Cytophagaceae bacterium YF14B1]|uniref:PH domain-containing protein n=1 Tax=Xanthocytophaga flava TaxID=3048013 RepID=A0AAE3U6A5_9BACT|nr:PH domain-containing protein [Xanthocytophaga flavus]MDJ1481156.1 PH domain-containing protein [Xanthocytophaga flavus]